MQKAKVADEFTFHFPLFTFHSKKFAFICVYLWLIFLASCQSKPTDLRSLAPADTIIYLETNDLRKTLETLTESRAFREHARDKTDFSALENVQFAVAVTGFETSEQQVASEQSILNFKPRFVAIADTHAWKPAAVQIAENQIGKFARGTYGDDVKLEKSEKAGAKFFVWTSTTDGRKLFAAVSHSIIYVGNDESLLDKCLAVKRGEAESLLKNENLTRAREAMKSSYTKNAASAENPLAFGYITPEGIAQIANLAGVSLAIGATENDDARSFIASALPQVLQKTTKEIAWTASKTEQGIEDKIFVATTSETSSVFKETLQSFAQSQTNSAEFLPSDVFSITRYNLQNPQLAWRGLRFAAAKQTDARSAKILTQFSNSLFESYGASDADTFLSAIDSDILTAQFDADGEKSIAIVAVKNLENVKKSITEINFKSQPEKLADAEIWKSEDGEIAAAFAENKLILGDGEIVLKCLEAKQSGQNFTKNQYFSKFNDSKSVSITYTKDTDSAEKILKALGAPKEENKKITTIYLTETRFTENGIERKSVSTFGFIGTILEKIGE